MLNYKLQITMCQIGNHEFVCVIFKIYLVIYLPA
jgi:hypothetical protein